jgi:hypothetical protein
MMIDPAEERVLRAKYLDWCSAKVADRFLELTPEEIYDLAHCPSSGVAGEGGVVGTAVARREAPAALSFPGSGEGEPGLVYRALVERVTEVLTARLGLPPFEEWVAMYRAAPDRYEAELLGLWRERV